MNFRHWFVASLIASTLEGAGLYDSWLVELKPARSPQAPGSSTATPFERNRDQARHFSAFLQEHQAGSQPSSKGPRTAQSPSVKSFDSIWMVNSMRVSCRHEFLDELRSREDVIRVVPDHKVTLSLEPSSEEVSSPWLPDVDVLRLAGLQGQSVRVGVIDSGIVQHQAFSNRIAAYRDFTRNPHSQLTDEFGHGTHVAHLLAGGDLGDTAMSYAPHADLVVARVLETVPSDGTENEVRVRLQAFASRILAAMQWMLDPDDNPETADQPQVINNSWGFSEQMPLAQSFFDKAIQAWLEVGILPVFAAGNAGRGGADTVLFPGTHPGVLTVGSHNANLQRSSFSSMGSSLVRKPDILAPGEEQTALGSDGFLSMSGTSMAAPLVSGLFAALKSGYPQMEASDFRKLVVSTALDQGHTGWDTSYGHGVLQVESVLLSAEEKWGSSRELPDSQDCRGSQCLEWSREQVSALLNLADERAYAALQLKLNALQRESSTMAESVLRQVRQRLQHRLLMGDNPELESVLTTVYRH